MISLIVEFALFLLVLFVVVFGTVVLLTVGREALHHHRMPAPWHRDAMSKLLG